MKPFFDPGPAPPNALAPPPPSPLAELLTAGNGVFQQLDEDASVLDTHISEFFAASDARVQAAVNERLELQSQEEGLKKQVQAAHASFQQIFSVEVETPTGPEEQ